LPTMSSNSGASCIQNDNPKTLAHCNIVNVCCVSMTVHMDMAILLASTFQAGFWPKSTGLVIRGSVRSVINE